MPADFASAFDENLYSFEQVDTSLPSELLFYDGDNRLLGVRRYTDRESLEVSPRAYLLHALSPTPLAHLSESGFVTASGRDVTLLVGYNDDEDFTPPLLFTASHKALSASSPMGASEEWRTIAAGECDEVALCVAEGARVVAVVTFADGSSNVVDTHIAERKGVLLFGLSADSLLSHPLLPEGAESFDLSIDIDSARCLTLHYRLATAEREAVRLAWVTSYGTIGYHTFPPAAERRLCTTREECHTPTESPAARVAWWEEMTLHSGVLPLREGDRLADIVTSPRLWRVVDGSLLPLTLLDHSVEFAEGGTKSVSLTLRPASTVVCY